MVFRNFIVGSKGGIFFYNDIALFAGFAVLGV